MAEQALKPIEIEVDVGKALKPYQAVIGKKKRKLFLETLAKTLNFSKSAREIGVSRQSVYELIKRDESFKAAYQEVIDVISDTVEETRLSLALQPTRDGHQDAKMWLKARRPEVYGDKLQVDSKQTLRIEVSMPELKRILQGNNVQKADEPEAIPDAEFEVVS